MKLTHTAKARRPRATEVLRSLANGAMTALIRTLHRLRLIRATAQVMSDHAETIYGKALRAAGGYRSIDGTVLLEALLAHPDCGFCRHLEAKGVDLESLAVRISKLARPKAFGESFAPFLQRSYDVAPRERRHGKHDHWQVLHTVHFLWGFREDQSAGGRELRDAFPGLQQLTPTNGASPDWYDSR